MAIQPSGFKNLSIGVDESAKMVKVERMSDPEIEAKIADDLRPERERISKDRIK